jgi:hypothetical protein
MEDDERREVNAVGDRSAAIGRDAKDSTSPLEGCGTRTRDLTRLIVSENSAWVVFPSNTARLLHSKIPSGAKESRYRFSELGCVHVGMICFKHSLRVGYLSGYRRQRWCLNWLETRREQIANGFNL